MWGLPSRQGERVTRFTTETGSVYEVDAATKFIRRLSGVNDPSPRQGQDGVWKSYVECEARVGERTVIVWDPATTPLLPESNGFGVPMTITSRVVSIDHV